MDRRPAFATTYRETRIYAVNCRNERGRRLRKDRVLPAGTRLPIIGAGIATGVIVHGEPYHAVMDGEGNRLILLGSQAYLTERFDSPAPDWLTKINQMLADPAGVDPVQLNVLLQAMEASGTKEVPAFLYHELPERGIAKCDYCGWWVNREGAGHRPECWDPALKTN